MVFYKTSLLLTLEYLLSLQLSWMFARGKHSCNIWLHHLQNECRCYNFCNVGNKKDTCAASFLKESSIVAIAIRVWTCNTNYKNNRRGTVDKLWVRSKHLQVGRTVLPFERRYNLLEITTGRLQRRKRLKILGHETTVRSCLAKSWENIFPNHDVMKLKNVHVPFTVHEYSMWTAFRGWFVYFYQFWFICKAWVEKTCHNLRQKSRLWGRKLLRFSTVLLWYSTKVKGIADAWTIKLSSFVYLWPLICTLLSTSNNLIKKLPSFPQRFEVLYHDYIAIHAVNFLVQWNVKGATSIAASFVLLNQCIFLHCMGNFIHVCCTNHSHCWHLSDRIHPTVLSTLSVNSFTYFLLFGGMSAHSRWMSKIRNIPKAALSLSIGIIEHQI